MSALADSDADRGPLVAPTAMVATSASIGPRTKVWDLSQIREKASIGADCVVGANVYIDHEVVIGDRCKIQNNALIYWPARIGNGVFVGPGAVLTNDRHPRAVNPDSTLKVATEWQAAPIVVGDGASIGAKAVLIAGINVGPWAMIAAGAVVVRDVESHALVVGNPARQIGWVSKRGCRLVEGYSGLFDPISGERFHMGEHGLELLE